MSWVVAALVGAVMLLSACQIAPDASAQDEEVETVLTMGLMEPIDSLNPFIGVNDNAYIFYNIIYDSLNCVDEDGNVAPNLAESWYVVPEYEPLGSVWQYNLTHDAKWHDGQPFTAADVKFTIELQTGLNFDTFWAYQPYTALINSTVETPDQFTVRIHYQDLEGNPAAVTWGDALVLPIIPKHIWEDMSASDASFGFENEKPIGTGPFMATNNTYEEYLSGERLILLANHDYHKGAIDYDKLVIEFYLEPAAMVTDIQRGALDVAHFSAPNYRNLLLWLEDHPDAPIEAYNGLITTSFSVETSICMNPGGGDNPSRTDKAVRLAMAHATNKTWIRDQVYMGFAQEGVTIVGPRYGDFYWTPDESEYIDYDIDLANDILDAAGYVWDGDTRVAPAGHPYGLPGADVPLAYPVLVEQELFEDKATAEFLRDEWKKIGIDLTLVLVDTAQWNTQVYAADYDLAMTYWSGDKDPTYLLYTQSTKALGGWSENYYSNPYYDENYSNSVGEQDHAKRIEYVKNCQKIMYEDCAFIVNAYPYGCYAWRTDNFEGWGDWAAHPYRSISNYWSGNALWMDLTPVGEDGDDGGGVSGLALVAVAAVAVAIVAAAVFLMRRKKKPGKEEDESRLIR